MPALTLTYFHFRPKTIVSIVPKVHISVRHFPITNLLSKAAGTINLQDKYLRRVIPLLIKPFYKHAQYKIIPYELKKKVPRQKEMTELLERCYAISGSNRNFAVNIRTFQNAIYFPDSLRNLLLNDTELITKLLAFKEAHNLVINTIIIQKSDEIYPKLNLISGIMSKSKAFEDALNSTELIGIKCRKVVMEIMTKVIYNFVSVRADKLEENLFKAIGKIFANITGMQTETMPRELYDIIGENILPLTQSLCVFFWGNAKFNREEFQALSNKLGINVTSFNESDIRISTVIELYFMNQMKLFIEKNTSFVGEYNLIDHSGIDKVNNIFNTMESLDRTNQQHCDALITDKLALVSNNNNNNSLKLYCDFKTYVTFSVEYCRFSLFHANKYLLQRYIAEIPNMIKQYISKNGTDIDDVVNELYERLVRIKNKQRDIESLTFLKQTFDEMLKELIIAFTNPELQKLKLGFAIYLDIDEEYSLFYDKFVRSHFENIEGFVKEIKNMLPDKSEIHNDTHRQTMQTFIEQMLPEKMKQEALEYFEKVVTPRIS